MEAFALAYPLCAPYASVKTGRVDFVRIGGDGRRCGVSDGRVWAGRDP